MRLKALDSWLPDVRRAVIRVLARPHFSWIAIGILVLSVGTNVAVFSVVNALWLKPRALDRPDRVVMLLGSDRSSGTYSTLYWSARTLDRIAELPPFASVGGQVPAAGELDGNRLRVLLPGHRELEALAVTPSYFPTLGVPIQGREFSRNDDLPGAPPVAIISHELWQDALGSSPDVIGRSIETLPRSLTVIGVAPPGFRGARAGERVDLWVPRLATPLWATAGLAQPDPNLLGLARLTDGATVTSAERVLNQSGILPIPLRLLPIQRLYGSPASPTIAITEQPVLWVATMAAAIVLFGGCISLMAIVRAHYESREPEFRLCLALGSSRSRLVRPLALELGVIVLVGGLGAIAVAQLLVMAMPSINLPGGIDLSRLDLTADLRAAAVGLSVAATSAGFASLGAVRRAFRTDASGYLQGIHKDGRQSLVFRKNMLAVQVAAATTVLIGAGTFVQAVVQGRTIGPGFNSGQTVFAEFGLRMMGGPPLSAGQRAERNSVLAHRLDRVVAKVTSIPGVSRVSIGGPPISLENTTSAVAARDLAVDGALRSVRVSLLNVGVDYHDVLGLQLLAGRPLAADDVRAPAAPGDHPVLLTSGLARMLWGDEPPVGRRFGLSSDYSFLVVGVVSGFVVGSQAMAHRAAVLIPTDSLLSMRRHKAELAIRTAVAGANLKDSIGRAIAEELGGPSGLEVLTGNTIVDRDLGRDRLGAWFFSSFGLVSLALGLCSVFGLVSQLTATRRREIGVRLALGATVRGVSGLIVRGSLLPVSMGIATGAVASVVVGLGFHSLLGLGRWFDPLTYGAAGLVMFGSAVGSAFVAAWKVRTISPADILRS